MQVVNIKTFKSGIDDDLGNMLSLLILSYNYKYNCSTGLRNPLCSSAVLIMPSRFIYSLLCLLCVCVCMRARVCAARCMCLNVSQHMCCLLMAFVSKACIRFHVHPVLICTRPFGFCCSLCMLQCAMVHSYTLLCLCVLVCV